MIARCTHRVLSNRGAILAICAAPLSFVGIRGEGEKVERWYRASCGFYSVLNATGGVVRMTREEPRKGYFNHEHTLCRGKPVCVAG